MIDFLLQWAFPMIAITYIVGHSLLFEGVRRWPRWPAMVTALLSCPMCIGFWVGMLVGTMNCLPVHWPRWIQVPILGGLMAVAIEYVLEVALRVRDGRREGD